VAAAAALTLNVFFSTRILAGVAVLSIGLFVLSVGALVVELTSRNTRRRNAKRVYDEVGQVIKSTKPEEINKLREDALRSLLDETYENDRERDAARRSLQRKFEAELIVRIGEMWDAFDAIMKLSIDELAFLSRNQESEIAEFIDYAKSASWNTDRARWR
jgi:hypothetical protein